MHEGNLVMVTSDQVQMPANVYNLLKAVREEANRVLNGLEIGDLRLFPSHDDWCASHVRLDMAKSVDEMLLKERFGEETWCSEDWWASANTSQRQVWQRRVASRRHLRARSVEHP